MNLIHLKLIIFTYQFYLYFKLQFILFFIYFYKVN